ncbi:radical SAM protein [Limisalsivibrio acetivorans]|uniref:radical SAM protein n=1 Tax=Limisalsivibrio acetivorans TaxID=1304888 RepID=UPI0003B767A6|nr:radical SAM protein [Limisalsivibrio acetivorans]
MTNTTDIPTHSRGKLLYKSGVNFVEHALNPYSGCSHACRYPCYSFSMKKRFGMIKTLNEWKEPSLAENALEKLESELNGMRRLPENVFMSLSTDPFMYTTPWTNDISLSMIKILNERDIPVTVLTKGILPEELRGGHPKNEYGISLSSLDESFRRKFEPGASPYMERLEALKLLNSEGFRSWICIEPLPPEFISPTPFISLLDACSFADYLLLGKWNYSASTSARDYPDYYRKCENLFVKWCTKNGIEALTKESPNSVVRRN